MPHHIFTNLLQQLSEHPAFSKFITADALGEQRTDLYLLLLGALCYLGWSWTFDCLEENTAISRESHRSFFNEFIKYGSSILYQKYVTQPAKEMSMKDMSEMFQLAGFNGCIGSTDATHVPLLSCPSWATVSHKGHKLKIPCRSYNITVTHARQGTTSGHPSTWNNKTIVLFDELIYQINDGQYKDDYKFKLLEYDEKNNVVEVQYVGAWFIVDNGYLSWSCTVPPMKNPFTYKFVRLSEWLESMQKDVECTFGIMKGRFPMLRTGIRIRNISKCDQIWKTCCALHNLLLFVDGLHNHWESGKKSNWEKQFEQPKMKKLPYVLYCLNQNLEQSYNIESVDETELSDTDKKAIKRCTVNGERRLNKLPLKVFMKLLANHFDIRFKSDSIEWPRRIQTPIII